MRRDQGVVIVRRRRCDILVVVAMCVSVEGGAGWGGVGARIGAEGAGPCRRHHSNQESLHSSAVWWRAAARTLGLPQRVDDEQGLDRRVLSRAR
jgi:hypothetical protein